MHPNAILRSLLLWSSALIAASQSKADSGTWNANSAGNWSDATKWAGGIIADGTDFTATFGNVITANLVVTLDTDRVIGSISALDITHNYTISGTSLLTLDVRSGASALNVVTGRALTISTPVNVDDGLSKEGAGTLGFTGPVALASSQTWTNNSTGSLTTGNGANLIDNSGYQLTVDHSGAMNFGVINNDASSITGSGGLVKSGTGVLSLGGVNAGFTGMVTVNAGTLRVTKPGSLAGNLNLAGGIYEHYWSDAFTRTLGPDAGQVQITGGVSGFSENGNTSATFTINNSAAFELVWGALKEAGNDNATGFFNPSVFVLQAATAQQSSSLTLANKVDFNGSTRTIQVSGGTTGAARAAITGQVRNTSGTAGLIKNGAGMLNLTNAANAWNGATTVNGGVLDLGGMTNANLGGGPGVRDVTVAAGAGIRFAALSNAFLNRIVETSAEITVMTATTSNNLDFSSSTGANLPNAFLGNWASNGAKAEYSGTLTPAADNYRLGGRASNGLLGIVGTNKLTGSKGLIVGGTGSASRVNLAAAQDFTGDTVITSGARLTLGHNLALQNSALNVGAAGGNFSLAAGTNTGRITGETAAPAPTFGGLIGSRNLISVFSSGAGNNETNLTAAAVTGFTLNVGAGRTHSYSGAIGGFGTGASGTTGGNSTLTKSGNGTQILSGANTYTGTTTLDGGRLRLGAGNVIPDSSNVSIGAATLDAATFEDSAGTLSVTDAAATINFGSGAKLAFADSSAAAWTGTLNLTGGFVSGSSLRFGDGTGTGLTPDQLSRISAPGFGSFSLDGSGYLLAAPSGGGYSSWKSVNGTSQTIDLDHDGDGVPNGIEYFLGGSTNTSGLTALPVVINNAGALSVTWTKAASYTGSYGIHFAVETSDTLAGGTWTAEAAGVNVTLSGNEVKFTFPSPPGAKKFARLKVSGP